MLGILARANVSLPATATTKMNLGMVQDLRIHGAGAFIPVLWIADRGGYGAAGCARAGQGR